MKCRIGFVSNSSSSSFIVELQKPIEKYSLDEFVDLLNEHDLEAVKILFEDLIRVKDDKIEDWMIKFYHLPKELPENNYIIEYSDEDGEGYMEHDFMPYLNITKKIINQH